MCDVTGEILGGAPLQSHQAGSQDGADLPEVRRQVEITGLGPCMSGTRRFAPRVDRWAIGQYNRTATLRGTPHNAAPG
jgi:hypothetical protein